MNLLLKRLNLQKQELRAVKTILLFQMLQGAGIAMYVTLVSAVFIVKVGISQLPLAFIITAFCLWLTAFVHVKLERVWSSEKLNNLLLICISAIIISGFILLDKFGSETVLFLMFVLYPVLLLFNNLKLWSIASLLFDSQKSKRLNDIVSFIDIPSKLIGYVAASVLVEFLKPGHIFLVGGILVALSYFPLISLRKYKLMNAANLKHRVEQSDKDQLKKYISIFLNNKLVMNMALLSFIVYVVTIIVNYEFLDIVVRSFSDIQKVAMLIGLTMAAGKLLSLLIRLIFTDKILGSHGSNRLLSVTPIVMVVFVLAIGSISFMESSNIYLVIVFGAMFSFADVLRNSIFTPALSIMIQPLSIHERLRALIMIKGSMEPFAYLLCGILLMFAWLAAGEQSYFLIAFIIILLVVIWTFTSRAATFQYSQSVVNGGELTLFTNREFSVRDKETLHLIENKITSGDAVQVSHLLELLAGDANDESRKIILGGLKHSSWQVRVIASNLCDNLKIKDAVPPLKLIAVEAKNPSLKQAALKAVCNIGIDDDYVMQFFENENDALRNTALIGILQNGNEQSKSIAEKILDAMIQSDEVKKRLDAIAILKQLNSGIYIRQLIQLINDEDIKVSDEAILAAGKNASKDAITAIVTKINSNEQSVLNALHQAGEIALPIIKDVLLTNNVHSKYTMKLIQLCGRIGGNNAAEMLIDFIEMNPVYKNDALKALYTCGFVATGKQKQVIEKLIGQHFQNAIDVSNMMHQLQASGHNFTLLRSALKIELNSIRKSLLELFSFLYDKNLISRAATGFIIATKESESNAMESLEKAVSKNFSTPFNILFGGQTSKAIIKLREFNSQLPATIELMIDDILNDKNYFFNDWTKACAMYECRLNMIDIPDGGIKKMLASTNPLLIETADFAA